ncbi:MAG: hypothetical protein ACR2M1_06010 [Gemmatimonadaceae bacterium]
MRLPSVGSYPDTARAIDVHAGRDVARHMVTLASDADTLERHFGTNATAVKVRLLAAAGVVTPVHRDRRYQRAAEVARDADALVLCIADAVADGVKEYGRIGNRAQAELVSVVEAARAASRVLHAEEMRLTQEQEARHKTDPHSALESSPLEASELTPLTARAFLYFYLPSDSMKENWYQDFHTLPVSVRYEARDAALRILMAKTRTEPDITSPITGPEAFGLGTVDEADVNESIWRVAPSAPTPRVR